MSVRHVECGEAILYGDEEDRVTMPDYPKKWLVDCLYNNADQQSLGENNDKMDGKYVVDDRILPSISTLTDESISLIKSTPSLDQIVLAGEGEPTLRMDALLSISHQIQSHRRSNNESELPIRLITNGLVYTIPNFGYSPYNRHRGIPLHRHTVLRDMMEVGISRISVALNTSNRHEYDILMKPSCYTNHDTLPGTAHDLICEFILEAAKLGIDVEITGIDRPDVDKRETDRLARMLLSVAEVEKRSNVRWRKYFE